MLLKEKNIESHFVLAESHAREKGPSSREEERQHEKAPGKDPSFIQENS